MPIGIRMSAEALARVRKQFEDLPEVAQVVAAQEVQKAADRMVSMLQQTTPKHHAELVTTIKQFPGRLYPYSIRVSIGDAAHPYAAAVEFGHKLWFDAHGNVVKKGDPNAVRFVHVPPHPFFFTTAAIVREQFKKDVRSAVGKALRKGAGTYELRAYIRLLKEQQDG